MSLQVLEIRQPTVEEALNVLTNALSYRNRCPAKTFSPPLMFCSSPQRPQRLRENQAKA